MSAWMHDLMDDSLWLLSLHGVEEKHCFPLLNWYHPRPGLYLKQKKEGLCFFLLPIYFCIQKFNITSCTFCVTAKLLSRSYTKTKNIIGFQCNSMFSDGANFNKQLMFVEYISVEVGGSICC